MLKQTLFLATTLLSISGSAIAADDERWFEVEIYIFERQGNPYEEMLKNPANINQRQPVDMILPLFTTDISGASAGLTGCTEQQWIDNPEACHQQLDAGHVSYPSRIPMNIGAAQPQYAKVGESTVLLADSQAQFSDIIATLTQEADHKGLLHMTWQQSMQPRRLATPVRLIAGDDFSKRYNQDGYSIDHQQVAPVIPQFNFDIDFGTTAKKQPIWQLEGAINIYLDHYLYVETALTLREEGQKQLNTASLNDNAFSSEPYQTVSGTSSPLPYLYKIWMAQNKRVISDEIHYFDHPNMGMILQIRKMTQPSEMTDQLPEKPSQEVVIESNTQTEQTPSDH
ncbi:CsiV family protein [Shewanella sp. Isolate11]|uniref:CsiV family protein n=1 Tax=Shewanella sp. Isolate11 TaxID=2908530 RepID=UPI001EFE7C9E|nr:peptidoglycan binding protein CsiV [Shewanella sp. Isolate11]